jgi:hypothetical protein
MIFEKVLGKREAENDVESTFLESMNEKILNEKEKSHNELNLLNPENIDYNFELEDKA